MLPLMSLSTAEWQGFMQYVESQLGLPEPLSLEEYVRRWREIQDLQQAICEIEAMHEAAAGCGYSRDEIAAQYRDRLTKLLQQ